MHYKYQTAAFQNWCRTRRFLHVQHRLRWFKPSEALKTAVWSAGFMFFYALSERYGGRESCTMVVLWHCCWCPLNAHSGSGVLKSILKGLADQRSVSSVNSAAVSNARDMLWQRSGAKRLTAESLMTSLYNTRENTQTNKEMEQIKYMFNKEGNNYTAVKHLVHTEY